jgi:hypothetical protein
MLAATTVALIATAPAQTSADDPIVVSAEHPRLFLRPSRLRLLKRERERSSMRWRQFESLVRDNAEFPEPGFAWALYYAISADEAVGRRAVSWALGAAGDLRQMALVFDWCQPLFSPAQQRALIARMQRRMAETAGDDSVSAVRARMLAAIALFDETPQGPARELERDVRRWWLGKLAPALKSGSAALARDDAYPFWELLHALRDTANLELRDDAPDYFRDFPIEHLLSYYPAPYPAPENDYYIGASRRVGEPDLRLAALSRAAELAMVAYDVNAPESQLLQGWLMHDRFLMRSPMGSPYEFLWANPYQPGLSYVNAPLVFYDPAPGRLFVRSSWEETARWFGVFDGVTQTFSDGRAMNLNLDLAAGPLAMTEAMICFGKLSRRFTVALDDEQPVFVTGLEPRRAYAVEVDDEELYEAAADTAGLLELDDVPYGKSVGIRLAAVGRTPSSARDAHVPLPR